MLAVSIVSGAAAAELLFCCVTQRATASAVASARARSSPSVWHVELPDVELSGKLYVPGPGNVVCRTLATEVSS